MADGSVVFKIDVDTRALKDDLDAAQKTLTKWADDVAKTLTVPVNVDTSDAASAFSQLDTSQKKAASSSASLAGNASNAATSISKLDASQGEAASSSALLSGNMGTLVKTMAGATVVKKAAELLWEAAKAGVEYNAQMEQYENNFTVLLGDEAEALQYVSQMRQTAAKTPFGMEDLASASQTLLSFGISAEDTSAAIQMLGDISMGNADRFGSLSLAFAQVSSAGKLTGQDLMQMINAGFNPLSTIAEKTGVSIADLKEVMSGGKASKEFRAQVKEAQKEVRKMGDNASESAKWLAKIGEEGMISAEMVSMAMQAETGVGGRFYQGMEKASQTLSGMWSTLKDDSMQLLGNLFEPVSDGLAKYVLPAAQGVVSALNGLFEGDTNLVITADVQEAIKNVGSLDTDLAALMVDYQNKVIKIRLEADKAEELVTELEKLEEQLSGTPKSLWTEQDKKDLQEITSRLVAIYPELQKYVGNDGILKLEAAEVQNLITKYENLALAKAEAEYRSAYEGRVEEARINQEMLEVELDGYKQQKQEAEALQQTWQKLSEDSSKAYGDFLFSPTGIPENLDASSVEEYLSLVEKYVQLAGGLEGLDSDSIIRGLFDETGQILDAESFLADMELLGNLANSLTEIDTLAQTQAKKQDEIISQTSEAISLTSQAVEAAKASVSQAIAELARFEEALARLNAEGQQEQKETGAETVNNIAQGADENSNELDDTVKNVVDGSAQSVDTSAFSSVGNNIVSGIVSGVYKNSGSLTKAMVDIANIALDAAKRGLDINSPSGRFRDEVGAMIPRGVAVGVEQNAWRVARSVTGMVDASLPDVSGIASGMAPRPLMLSGLRYAPSSTEASGVTNQTINFNVPVQTPGEFAQTMYLYQTYGLTEA